MKYLSNDAVARLRQIVDTPDVSGTRYRIVGKIGRGGMGTVYKAEDAVLGRTIALKVLDEENEEAHIMAALEHPGIVPVHDAGRLPDGRVFYAMKLVEGVPFHEAKVPLPDRLRMFQKVCEAVAFAHSRGVVHGDLKPENIMIGAFGEALVLDWGVAALALRGSIAGTRGFIAPEQAEGTAMDARSDIFSLGAILSEVSSGEPARPALQSICAKAMAERPQDRYASALELRTEIARYLDGERVEAHRETMWERAGRLFAHHYMWILLVTAYLVMRMMLLLVLHR
jgi:eukaryotic-like serine/threonine-protein kinase